MTNIRIVRSGGFLSLSDRSKEHGMIVLNLTHRRRFPRKWEVKGTHPSEERKALRDDHSKDRKPLMTAEERKALRDQLKKVRKETPLSKYYSIRTSGVNILIVVNPDSLEIYQIVNNVYNRVEILNHETVIPNLNPQLEGLTISTIDTSFSIRYHNRVITNTTFSNSTETVGFGDGNLTITRN